MTGGGATTGFSSTNGGVGGTGGAVSTGGAIISVTGAIGLIGTGSALIGARATTGLLGLTDAEAARLTFGVTGTATGSSNFAGAATVSLAVATFATGAVGAMSLLGIEAGPIGTLRSCAAAGVVFLAVL